MLRCSLVCCFFMVICGACASSTPQNSAGLEQVTPESQEGSQASAVTWITAIKDLPEGHPCEDSARVVRLECTDENMPCDGFEKRIISTLGEEYQASKAYAGQAPHFGDRRVKGVRWSSDRGEHVVISCHMSGSSIRRLVEPGAGEVDSSVWRWARKGADLEGEAFSIDFALPYLSGGYSYTSIVEMYRPDDASPWQLMSEQGAVSWDDGENPSWWAFSWSDVLDISDHDSDGELEVTSMSLYKVKSDTEPTYEAILFTSDGEHKELGTVALNCEGKTLEERWSKDEGNTLPESVHTVFFDRAREAVRQDCSD